MAEYEVWKSIPGHKHYEASNLGNIRSVGSRQGGRILKKYLAKRGYEQVSLGRERKLYVHQIILLAFIGPRPEGMEARHLDGNRANNGLNNLKYGTRAENCADRLKHGRSNRGRRLIVCEICGAKRQPSATNP